MQQSTCQQILIIIFHQSNFIAQAILKNKNQTTMRYMIYTGYNVCIHFFIYFYGKRFKRSVIVLDYVWKLLKMYENRRRAINF